MEGVWKRTWESTHAQDLTQVLYNWYLMFDSVISHFHITSYLTELSVFGDFLRMWTFCDACH